MEIRLRPELAELIKEDVQRGCYQNVDEFVERAVSLLHEQEAWLAENRPAIATKIQEGYDAAERGELMNPDEARAKLSAMRRSAGNDSQRR